MNTTAYQPMTLTKHRDGHRYGTLTSNQTGEQVEYRVKVESVDKGKYLTISVVGGDIPVYRRAGMLVREAAGGRYRLHTADPETGKLDSGYSDQGTMVWFAERIVHGFLNALDYVTKQAAKTPEQLAADEQAIREGRNGAFNARLAKGAEALLAEIDLLVPSSTAHYAVEEARQALATLIREASKSSIQTTALMEA
jgi:hypothetical protein